MSLRRLVVALVVGVLALAGAGAAHAATTARLTAAQTVTSATWGIKPAGVGGTGSPSLTWSVVDGSLATPRYFTVVNTGSAKLTGTTWTATVTRPGNNGNVPSVRFDACVGATWNASANTCAGTTTVIGTSLDKVGTMSVASAVTAANAGSVLSVRATPDASLGQTITAVVSTSVNSSTQVSLPGSTTNS